ncbi:L-arabinose isomerase [Alicyclobacillus contaminans]|nr:L-arabinose isomerase [Alicyclobacillus contaminans]
MSEARRETTPVFWFVVGSQHLYGPETLERVESQARRIVRSFNDDASLPYKLDMKPLMTTPEAIAQLCAEANTDPTCAGVLTWMHTFSPAKMWIGGLTVLKKPLLHLHTQYHDAIPWKTVDMNFMNLNQAAHGDREFAFIGARLGVRRKVLAGHWADRGLRRRLAEWMCTAVAVNEGHSLKVARFGDNMRQVAVTEGDKVAAQAQFGWAVHAYGVGDLVDCMAYVSEAEVESLVQTYRDMYEIAKGTLEDAPYWSAVREQARMELGLRRFLYQGGFTAFTTNFEDLHGLRQLPGLAVQRLMADGFGFGGEGDWKTAALVRVVKRMAGFEGTSFMEDYTYHLVPGEESTLGAHMLEVCPTIAADTPRLEVHPLSIGGRNRRRGSCLQANQGLRWSRRWWTSGIGSDSL